MKRYKITRCCWVKHKKSGKLLYVDGWTEPTQKYVKQEVYYKTGGWSYAHEVEIIPLSKLEKALT